MANTTKIHRPAWIDRASVRSAKLGTIPAFVEVHGSDVPRITPGNWVRVREAERGKWSRVLVVSVDARTGYFQADR